LPKRGDATRWQADRLRLCTSGPARRMMMTVEFHEESEPGISVTLNIW